MTYEEEAAERIKPHIGEYWCLAFHNAIVPYSHGYVDGRKESEQEINRLNGEIKEILEDNDTLNKWIDELKEKIKGLEAGEVCWQGDMDKTIAQNIALKAEIEELKMHCKAVDDVNERMKCCGNCKYLDNLDSCLFSNGRECCDQWELFTSAD